MKKALLTMLVLLLASGAYAGIEQTGRGVYTTPIPPITDWLNDNDCIYHVHDFYVDKLENPYGIGVDVKVLDFGKTNINAPMKKFLQSVNVESRYDMNNDMYSVYVVLDVDVTSLWQ